jgi:hypothetical protein
MKKNNVKLALVLSAILGALSFFVNAVSGYEFPKFVDVYIPVYDTITVYEEGDNKMQQEIASFHVKTSLGGKHGPITDGSFGTKNNYFVKYDFFYKDGLERVRFDVILLDMNGSRTSLSNQSLALFSNKTYYKITSSLLQ